jgi:hypothetical protein
MFRWIDGRKSIDEESYQIRFTPENQTVFGALSTLKNRKAHQKRINISQELLLLRKDKNTNQKYMLSKRKNATFRRIFKKFKSNSIAWEYFENLAPSYKNINSLDNEC